MPKDVSLHKVRHPRYQWRVSYRSVDESGRSERKQAYFVKRGEADAFANARSVELANHGAKHAHVEDDERIALVRYRLWAAKQASPPTLVDLMERAIATFESAHAPLTVSEAIKARIDTAKKRGLSRPHIADLEQRLRRFEQDFGAKQVADVKPQEIEAWLHRNAVAAQTWHNLARVVGSAFELAVKRGFLAASPVSRIDRPKIKRKAPAILAAEELARLLNAASPALRPLLVLQAFCGVRRAEANRLRWEFIHLDGQPYIELPSEVTKTNRRRTVDLPPCAVAWLAPDSKAPEATLTMETGTYRDHLRDAAKASGITWENNLLRHSFGTYRLATTRNAALVAEEMGNSVGVVRTHYANVTKPEAAAAWWAVLPPAAGAAGA